MNWKLNIIILYSAFVLLILSGVYVSVKQDIYLVKDDYYSADLAHDSHMMKVRNTALLEEGLSIVYTPDVQKLNIQFPNGQTDVTGEIHLYRPSNGDLDKHIVIDLSNDQRQIISTESLKAGLWRIKIEWTNQGEAYYYEKPIII